jgi:hypothetical protein
MTINCDDFKPKRVPAGTNTCDGDCRCHDRQPSDETCAANGRICAFCCSEHFCKTSMFQRQQIEAGAVNHAPSWVHRDDHRVGVVASSSF